MKRQSTLSFSVLSAILLLAGHTALAQDATNQPTSTNGAPTEPAVIPYPLSTCVVSGEKLGEMGDPNVFIYEGHEIKLCCKSCEKKFRKDAEAYLKKLEIKPYLLSKCLVSGETLGEMGDPIRIVYEGQEIKFCCKSCPKKFEKDPETYLKKLEEQTKK